MSVYISSSTPSPSTRTKMKISPTESVEKKSALQSSSRTILPKSLTTIDNNNNKNNNSKKVQTKHSLQTCQNDAKPQHPSYLSVYHSKIINNTKPTSSSVKHHHHHHQHQQHQQNQIPSKQLNGSYARVTNQLNYCKNCVRSDDNGNNIKKSNGYCVSMPKLTKDTESQQIHSSNYSKYKLPTTSNHQSIISATFRRNSMDTNAIRLNSIYKRSFDDEYFLYKNNNGNVSRRQSFDDVSVREITPQKLSQKASPSQGQLNQHNHHNTITKIHRNGNVCDNKCHLSHLINNNSITTSNDNRRLIKQMSSDEYTSATSRLRKLEMKMRKHKIDVLKYVNGKEQSNGRFDEQTEKLLSYHTPNHHFQTKLDPFMRTKSDSLYPKRAVESILQTKTSNLRKSTVNGSYGIISAADLYKLRATSTAEHFT